MLQYTLDYHLQKVKHPEIQKDDCNVDESQVTQPEKFQDFVWN